MIYTQLEKAMTDLPQPRAVGEKRFDDFLTELIGEAKEILGHDWQPLESDPYMKNLRILALRKVHDQANRNAIIRELLITTATGDDLDHLGLSRGVARDEGEYPTANYEFALSTPLDEDVTIPAGTRLNSDDDRYQAETMIDARIPAGSDRVITRVQLLDFIPTSDIDISNIVTTLPYVAAARQMEPFAAGDGRESDDRYRLRIMAALARSSTAGGENAYRWYAYAADSRIRDVYVTSAPGSLIVDVYVYGDPVDDAMIQRVTDALNAQEVRPLSDQVRVQSATIKPVTVTATIEVFSLLEAGRIKEAIEANFADAFGLGVDLVRSDVDRKCHVEGVYRVVSDFADVLVDRHEVVKLDRLDLNFVEVDHA